MLDDRNYMRSRRPLGSDGAAAIKCVFAIIIINVLFFILVHPASQLMYELELSAPGIKSLKLWELFTYMFLHGNIFHLLFNMWGLYIFGTIVAPELGVSRFLNVYFISGITGGALWVVFNWNSFIPVIGASGALFGVMMATAMLYPDQEFMLLLFPIPMKTKTLVMVFAIIEILSNFKQDGVAHLAHLGGFVAAYIYIKAVYKDRAWDMFAFLKGGQRQKPHSSSSGGIDPKDFFRTKKTRGWTVHDLEDEEKSEDSTPASPDEPVSQRELDRILDKISRDGINSLTKEENDTLKRAREQMKRR